MLYKRSAPSRQQIKKSAASRRVFVDCVTLRKPKAEQIGRLAASGSTALGRVRLETDILRNRLIINERIIAIASDLLYGNCCC